MGADTKIQWTDFTFNGWMGCTKVSAGCKFCYAEHATPVRINGVQWGKGRPRYRTKEAYWKAPLTWNRAAERGRFVQCDGCGKREIRKWDNTLPPGGLACCSTPGCTALPESEISVVRPRVFCASLADWLDDEVPIEWLADLLKLIFVTGNLDWLLLTKRPENWRPRITAAWEVLRATDPSGQVAGVVQWWLHNNTPPANVWIGTSVEDQANADRRIPQLLEIPARVRFLSCEPLLGPLRWNPAWWNQRGGKGLAPADIHWVIAGGESGKADKCRPCDINWLRSIVAQCRAAGVPCFIKQMGSKARVGFQTASDLGTIPVTFDHPKGGDINEWAADLRIRQFPTP